MVGQLVLVQSIGVRIPVPEHKKRLFKIQPLNGQSGFATSSDVAPCRMTGRIPVPEHLY